MAHPLVEQLRFTRSEWLRGLESVTAEEAAQRFEPINSIAWMVGHLAWQEQRYWLQAAQGKTLVESVIACGFGQPPSNPPLDDMWRAWRTITIAADSYLDTLTSEMLEIHYVINGQPVPESPGTLLRRTTYHYWYHLGESQAVRQLLGHKELPWFVGSIGSEAPYRRETD
jgi:DinB family protein